MSEARPRFCPRCGTARVSGMPFCPNCGLNLAELAPDAGGPASARAATSDTPGPSAQHPELTTIVDELGGPENADRPPTGPSRAAPVAVRTSAREGRFEGVPLPVLIAILLVGIIVILALSNAFGLFKGLGPRGVAVGASPSPTFSGPTFAPTSEAPPVGLSILSPTDGALVGSHQVTVIGSAPAGLQIVRDVPLWFDQRTTSDGTGHWAMTVDLNKGDNHLKFRLGDDKSTAREIKVTYSP